MKAATLSTLLATIAALLALTAAGPGRADDKALIDANTEKALAWLRDNGGATSKLLEQAAGVLIFPDVVRMGFGVGGEFGEGQLLVDGEAVEYYATSGQTFGLAKDTEFKAEVILFMNEASLRKFRDSRGWKVGVHGAVPVVSAGSAGSAGSADMLGIIFSEDGMAENLELDGNRFTKIIK